MGSDLPRQDKVKLAVFDIDGTIFRSSLTVELVNGLFRANLFPPEAKIAMEKHYLAWINRKGHYDTYLQSLVELLFTHIKGCAVEDVAQIAKQVLQWQKDRTYRYTRHLVTQFHKQGYLLLAISGSPSRIVSDFARGLGFHESIGLEYEIFNGKYTGKVSDMSPVTDKQKVLQGFLDRYDRTVDLQSSYGVGDTNADIPLLEMVGNPIAFNPNRGLAEHAKRKGWKIIVERKDVTYLIEDFDFGPRL